MVCRCGSVVVWRYRYVGVMVWSVGVMVWCVGVMLWKCTCRCDGVLV